MDAIIFILACCALLAAVMAVVALVRGVLTWRSFKRSTGSAKKLREGKRDKKK